MDLASGIVSSRDGSEAGCGCLLLLLLLLHGGGPLGEIWDQVTMSDSEGLFRKEVGF